MDFIPKDATKIPIIINGNDGTGKSTLVKFFNSISNNKYYMIERSTTNTFSEIKSDLIKWVDNETLKYTWDRKQTNVLNDYSVYHFILDLEPKTINKRIGLLLVAKKFIFLDNSYIYINY